MEKAKRREVRAKRLVLTLVALGIVLAAVNSVGLAAPASSTTSSLRSVTVFDPFTLKTVVLNSAPSKIRSTGALGLIKNPNPRRPIRIPFRPNCRSGFRPHSDC